MNKIFYCDVQSVNGEIYRNVVYKPVKGFISIKKNKIEVEKILKIHADLGASNTEK